jgi:hypothetical protein
MKRSFHKNVVHADGGDFYFEGFDAEFPYKIMLKRLSAFRAKAADALVGVITGKRGEIHAGDRAEEPRCLPFLFYRAARYLRLCEALDRAGVHANFLHPIQIEWNSGVGQQRAAA